MQNDYENDFQSRGAFGVKTSPPIHILHSPQPLHEWRHNPSRMHGVNIEYTSNTKKPSRERA